MPIAPLLRALGGAGHPPPGGYPLGPPPRGTPPGEAPLGYPQPPQGRLRWPRPVVPVPGLPVSHGRDSAPPKQRRVATPAPATGTPRDPRTHSSDPHRPTAGTHRPAAPSRPPQQRHRRPSGPLEGDRSQGWMGMLGGAGVSPGSEGILWTRGVQAWPRPRKEGARREHGGEEREIPAQCPPQCSQSLQCPRSRAASLCSALSPVLPVLPVPGLPGYMCVVPCLCRVSDTRVQCWSMSMPCQ